jgi:hypothetical protein
MGYIRSNISLDRDSVEPEVCQCTALVIRACSASASARRHVSRCSKRGNAALRF